MGIEGLTVQLRGLVDVGRIKVRDYARWDQMSVKLRYIVKSAPPVLAPHVDQPPRSVQVANVFKSVLKRVGIPSATKFVRKPRPKNNLHNRQPIEKPTPQLLVKQIHTTHSLERRTRTKNIIPGTRSNLEVPQIPRQPKISRVIKQPRNSSRILERKLPRTEQSELLLVYDYDGPRRVDSCLISIDFVAAELGIVIEYDGWYWHKEKFDSDTRKSRLLEDLGWTVVRIRERGSRQERLPLLDVPFIECGSNEPAHVVAERICVLLRSLVPTAFNEIDDAHSALSDK